MHGSSRTLADKIKRASPIQKIILRIKGARYLLIIHEVLIAMLLFFPAGVQDDTLKEESQRLAS